MECFRSGFEEEPKEVWVNTKSNFDRSITKRFHYKNTISKKKATLWCMIEKQGKSIKAAWLLQVLSQIGDLKLRIPVSVVSGVIPQVKPLAYWNKLLNMPWVSCGFFRSCCSEHIFDGPLEKRGLGECGAITGYGQRKEQQIFWWYESQSLRSFCRLIDSEIMRAFKQPASLEDTPSLICFY